MGKRVLGGEGSRNVTHEGIQVAGKRVKEGRGTGSFWGSKKKKHKKGSHLKKGGKSRGGAKGGGSPNGGGES